jgi:hypothetical protein
MEHNESPRAVEPWMRGLLLLAGAYNIGWGIFIYVFPNSFYQWITQTERLASALITWQGVGVLTFGVAYILAAVYPIRLWFVIGLGFSSKLIGAVGFYFVVMEQKFTEKYIFHLIMNDTAWLIPLGIIFVRVWQIRQTQRVSL